jgi:uncharacterized membrane protein
MKKHIFAGLVILLPLVLTILVLVFILNLFTEPFLNIATFALSKFPHLYQFLQAYDLVDVIARICSLIMTVAFILFLGMIAQMFFIDSLLHFTNNLICKIPFIKSIYKTSKDVIQALFPAKDEKKAFKRSVMIPFPSKKSHCVGFVSGEIPKVCQEQAKETLIPVFVPTAPHPISGYFMLVPEKKVHEINMSNEEAVKFTVSCGVIGPEREKTHES